jgi:hypothetical protein
VATLATPALATDVGVSVKIGQPGFYGRIYMRVPPGHAKNWKKYCHQYDACGYPVYFVQDSWYEHDYVPNYREYHRDRHGDHGGDYYEDHRKENHGNSKKHDGNGHDKKKGNGQNH